MPYVTLTTAAGTLHGIDDGAVATFLGVPYGASTAGVNRFQAPQPVPAWVGVREARSFGPVSPQLDGRLGASPTGIALQRLQYPRGSSALEGSVMSEDCLRLDLWAPSGATASSLPVLVWLHGGGYLAGTGNEMWFNGDVLAARGDVVVVTVTHRLGLMGFLDLRSHGYPDSANAGMLDIVAALNWVRDNIGSLGGDPDRVTILGQSGGSGKVAALNAMPAAEGLFARSIMMSGPFDKVISHAGAEAIRDRALSVLPDPSSGYADLPIEVFLDAQAHALFTGPTTFGEVSMVEMMGFGATLDATHLPAHPIGVEVAAGFHGRDLMIGWTTHEVSSLFVDQPAFGTHMTDDHAVGWLNSMSGGHGRVLYDGLAAAFQSEPAHLKLSRILSKQMFQEPARDIADRVSTVARNVWVYEFAEQTEVLDGLLGSCHSLDIAYWFGTVGRIPLTGSGEERELLARQMADALVTFASVGIPRTAEGWEPWDPENPEPFVLGR